jgi:hypothetical protein
MKIRNGFVSNSSSSSFVVAFNEIPTSIEDVQRVIFGAKEHFKSEYGNTLYDTFDIASTIWGDIFEQTPNNIKKISESISGGYCSDRPDYDDYKNKDGQIDWKRYQKACDKISTKKAKEFIKDNSGKYIYVFSYSDNDGDYFSTMEHGDIFSNLNHIRTSYH